MASKISVKLLVDTQSRKVLLAEAGKDFVDFMLSLLTLPMGSVIKLLSPKSMKGGLGKLYQSVENISETYWVSNQGKGALLQPKVWLSGSQSNLLLKGSGATDVVLYYGCPRCRLITASSNCKCPNCNVVMNLEKEFVMPSEAAGSSSGAEGGGYVQGVVTYMVTDNLEVAAMSAISCIALINKVCGKKDIELEEKVVSVGMEEGLALLQASLYSMTALTDVFLGKRAASKSSASSA